MALFKKVACFTDIHYGLKSNSITHLKDCEEFVDWFIQEAKDAGCETAIFLGDWSHNRNSLNLFTLDSSLRCLEKLGAAFEQFFWFPGNHDLFYKFSGHFHKRQENNKVIYIGNAFPHNFSDTWDDKRGMMTLEWGGEPNFIDWPDCPKYRSVKLSDLIDNADTIMKSKMHLKVNLDIDISFEEANFIKETFIRDYDIREISLIQDKTNLEGTIDDNPDGMFESVDHIVTEQLINIESEQFDKTTLLEIYNNL